MVCKNCGSYNDDSANFCIGCGNALSEQQEHNDAENINQGYNNYSNVNTPPAASYNQPYNNYNQYPPAPVPGKGLAIAGMVCGIVSLALCMLVVPAILGIVFGGVAKSKGYKGGEATAGIVCGAVALGIFVLYIIIVIAAGTSAVTYSGLYNL